MTKNKPLPLKKNYISSSLFSCYSCRGDKDKKSPIKNKKCQVVRHSLLKNPEHTKDSLISPRIAYGTHSAAVIKEKMKADRTK